MGRDAAVEINQMYAKYISSGCSKGVCNSRAMSVPRWSELDHFSNYVDETFTDGTRWENMSKVRYSTIHLFLLLTNHVHAFVRYVSK